jgi:hypothetical protein
VFVTSDASQEILEFLKRKEAEVVVGGKTSSKAMKKAKAAVAADPHAYVS